MKLFPEQWAAEGVRQSDFPEQEMPATVMPGSPVQLNGVTPESAHPQSVSQPQPAFQIQPVTPDPAPSQPRETWGGKYEFLLSCIGYCVGLGNVWRFPYLCYRNGGGVFLIPYFVMLLFTGLPLFLLELSLGQYGAAGPITVWKCCPLLKGIGVGMLLVSSLVSLYYNVIIAWTFYYLGMSFQSPLPWSCDAPQNARLCQNASGNSSRFSASEAFWNEQVLGVTHSSGLHDPGPVRWPLAICLLVAWIVIFLCMLKGIRSSGKVVYFTATFPYLVLVVLIIRGATLEGSIEGVRFYLSSDWSRLQSAQVWNDAASQIFYSLGIGFGGLLSMASYNKFDNNVIRDTLVIAIGNCCTSFFAGFAIFSILGHMAWRKRVPVREVADSGPGLAFVAYPEALALLPGSAFWSVLFFLMMFTLGVDTLFGNMEGITTAVLDEFPALREWRWKTVFLGALCFTFYMLGLLLITEGGIYWFTLIDAYSTSFGLIIITLFMCVGIAFFYGVNQFCQDIVDMICRCPPWCSKLLLYFKACWVFITPCLLLVVHPLLHLPGDVQHVPALRRLHLPALGQGPGRVHGHRHLHPDPALGAGGRLQGVGDADGPVPESHPPPELLAYGDHPRRGHRRPLHHQPGGQRLRQPAPGEQRGLRGGGWAADGGSRPGSAASSSRPLAPLSVLGSCSWPRWGSLRGGGRGPALTGRAGGCSWPLARRRRFSAGTATPVPGGLDWGDPLGSAQGCDQPSAGRFARGARPLRP